MSRRAANGGGEHIFIDFEYVYRRLIDAPLLSLASRRLLPRSAPRPLPPPMLLYVFPPLGVFAASCSPFSIRMPAEFIRRPFNGLLSLRPRRESDLDCSCLLRCRSSSELEPPARLRGGGTLSGARIAPFLLPGLFVRLPAFSRFPLIHTPCQACSY